MGQGVHVAQVDGGVDPGGGGGLIFFHKYYGLVVGGWFIFGDGEEGIVGDGVGDGKGFGGIWEGEMLGLGLVGGGEWEGVGVGLQFDHVLIYKRSILILEKI